MTMPFGLLLQLAWRNLWRHRRRNALLLTAIAVGVAAAVLMNALIRGYQYDMVDTAVANLTGHVKVLAPGYLDDPSIARSFELAPAWRPDVPAAALAGWTTRVRVPAVVMSERETRGVQLVGVDPSDEAHLSFIGDARIDGEGLAGADDGRILLGAELAAQLRTDVGRRVVVITQGADGLNREAGYRIAGLYDAEGTSLELAYAFTGRSRLQRLLDTHAVTELSVRLVKEDGPESLDAELARELPDLDVRTWRDLEPMAAAMFSFADAAIFVWFVIVLIALGFGLVNSLVTAVMERVREFGMLRALGMRPAQIVVQVMVESTLVVLLGVTVGILAGAALVAYYGAGIDLSRWAEGAALAGARSTLVPRLLPQDLVVVTAMAAAFGLLGSLYPAWRAVKIQPLDALRRGT